MNAANIFVGVLVVVLIILGPLASIWSVNILFGTEIPYTLKTWLASMVLVGTIKSITLRGKSN